jgi:GT2 family glycosyltransferase
MTGGKITPKKPHKQHKKAIKVPQGTDRPYPLISIIMATYNRSNILAYTIQSVLWSTYKDWELLVVGDSCTDDTEEVVASFEDPRVSFINLERNFGEQSGPNNEGFRRARGRYIEGTTNRTSSYRLLAGFYDESS